MKNPAFFLILLTLFSVDAFAAPHTDSTGMGADTIDKVILLKLVNAARKAGCQCGSDYFKPAPPLTWNAKLENAAWAHSNEMQAKRYFSHTDLKGNGAGARLTEAGYQWKTYGENIASGSFTEQEVVSGWLKSPSHCKNIMDKGFKEMGIGRAGRYWTQVFAAGR